MHTLDSLATQVHAIQWHKHRVHRLKIGCVCTDYARVVVRLFGGEIYGFTREQNPFSRIAQDYSGHDFAVHEARFIIDPWLEHVASEYMIGQQVFDMSDPQQSSLIHDLYGPHDCWERVEE